jgi:uncharacterized membrane protein
VQKNTIEKVQFFILLLICSLNYGQTVRKYSNEFMNIGVDAAALGMANAVVASTDDVNSGTIQRAYPSWKTILDARQLLCKYRNMIISLMPYR